MKVLHEWFVRISKNEVLLFMGYMTEKDNIITLTNRTLTGELKMFKLDI